jgi:hypothetical protein
MALGVKAQLGEDVSQRVDELLKTAFDHLDIWVDGTPAENKRSLLSRLKWNAELASQSSPAQAKILMDAYQSGMSKLSAI